MSIGRKLECMCDVGKKITIYVLFKIVLEKLLKHENTGGT